MNRFSKWLFKDVVLMPPATLLISRDWAGLFGGKTAWVTYVFEAFDEMSVSWRKDVG